MIYNVHNLKSMFVCMLNTLCWGSFSMNYDDQVVALLRCY